MDAAAVERVRGLRRAAGLTVSVCIPARDEESTVGGLVAALRPLLDAGLVDEIAVYDDGSTDATARVAAAAGARVVDTTDLLADVAPGPGKGQVLWKSLFDCAGDLVVWLDADLADPDPAWVLALVEPLLADPAVSLVKARYHRPMGDDGRGGGRVTELVARPLLATLFPELAAVTQPLGGEYAGRRSVLEQLPFLGGWAVETGLVLDVARRTGPGSIVEVDLGRRLHRHRPLHELAPQALAVQLAVLDRSGLRPGAEGSVTLPGPPGTVPVEVALVELPPLVLLPEYDLRAPRSRPSPPTPPTSAAPAPRPR